MNDAKKLSRRDWFRLRIPHQNRLLSDSEATSGSESLKPIVHPPNHDGMDLSDLPPMREAILAADQVNELFDDIEKLTTDVLLMQRTHGSPRANASRADTSSQLGFAKSSLLSGQLQRLQVRYRWKDSLWIDTLTAQGDGYRLVRIAHRSAPN
jgi:hypothetical protein